MRQSLLVVLAVLAFFGLAGAAFADAIDGDWCHQQSGRRFSIRGPQIVTPGGKQMLGNYSRHWFDYVVPAPEPGAGRTVFMRLLDENTVHLRVGDENAAEAETWIRCSPTTSALRAPPQS
ncbi:MAG TPA: hypothetical protein VFB31_04190 [Pseudolabrys sp.]|nr:hypothetical protein [Pseudolabrys sp.]